MIIYINTFNTLKLLVICLHIDIMSTSKKTKDVQKTKRWTVSIPLKTNIQLLILQLSSKYAQHCSTDTMCTRYLALW